MIRTTALVTVLCFGGCSFLNVHGPGSVGTPPARYVVCDEVSMYPFLDVGIAVLTALSISAAFWKAEQNSSEIATAFIWPVAFGASAAYGFTRESACKDHHVAWARAHPESPNGPPVYAYPPPGYGYPPPGYGYPPPQPQPQPQPQPPQTPAGYEGGSCSATVACVQGLVCASDLCVRPPD